MVDWISHLEYFFPKEGSKAHIDDTIMKARVFKDVNSLLEHICG